MEAKAGSTTAQTTYPNQQQQQYGYGKGNPQQYNSYAKGGKQGQYMQQNWGNTHNQASYPNGAQSGKASYLGGTYPVMEASGSGQEQISSVFLGTVQKDSRNARSLATPKVYRKPTSLLSPNKVACLTTEADDIMEGDFDAEFPTMHTFVSKPTYAKANKKLGQQHKTKWVPMEMVPEACSECNCITNVLSIEEDDNQEHVMYTCPDSGNRSRWTRKEAMVDSGACDHVCSPTFLHMVPTNETETSKSRKCYVSANGGKMRNPGRQDVFGYFTNGQPLGMKLQVTENITQTLLSVSKLEASGNDVIFSDEGSYIYNRPTESCIPIRRENASYKLDFWVENPDPFPKPHWEHSKCCRNNSECIGQLHGTKLQEW